MTSRKGDLRPVGAVVKHEFLLDNLALLVKVGSGLDSILNSNINRNQIRRDPIRKLALSIMNDPERRIWLWPRGIRKLGHQPIATS